MTTKPWQRQDLWEDPNFPANKSSLGFGDSPPKEFDSWMRPGEIVENLNKREKKKKEDEYKPKFIVNDISRFDVAQGVLEDCWLVSVLSCIANEDGVGANNHKNRWFNQVVPKQTEFDDENYKGVFSFRFWHYGKWVPITVDDRLPVNKEGKLIFAHSRPTELNEFWAALLEKAYAKLYGSYNSLSFGSPGESFTDLTGGVYRMVKLEDASEEKIKKALRKSLNKSGYKTECCKLHLAAAVIAKNVSPGMLQGTGLTPKHVYSITAMTAPREVKKLNGDEVDLIRVRDPRGNKWKLQWSDDSKEWEEVDENTKKRLLTKEHGEFWMPLTSFIKYFTVINICVVPEAFSQENQIIQDFEWTPTADPMPQFRLIATDNNMLEFSYIQMMQKCREKLEEENRFFNIGFKMLKISESNNDCFDMVEIYKSCRALHQRSVVKFLKDTEPGQYVIVPITDSLIKEGKFLRLCQYKTTWKLEKIESSSYESCLKNLFEPVPKDEILNGMDKQKLQKLLCTFLPEVLDCDQEALANNIVEDLLNCRNVKKIPNYKFSIYEFLYLMNLVKSNKDKILSSYQDNNKYPENILSTLSQFGELQKKLLKFFMVKSD